MKSTVLRKCAIPVVGCVVVLGLAAGARGADNLGGFVEREKTTGLAAGAREADKDKSAAMRKHFIKAVDAFRNAEYDSAAKALEKVLELNPSSADALELRDLAKVRFYLQAMRKGPSQMRADVQELLELAAEAEKHRLTDKDSIEKLIQQLAGPFEQRARVYVELVRAGCYAVPPLVDRLLDTDAADYAEYHVRASIALIRIGEEAVLPLCSALRSDSAPLREDICFILGRIGDPRAAPYLVRAAKIDPVESVRIVADGALARIRQYAEGPDEPPHVALLRHARLYYYRDPSIRRPGKYGHMVWNWSNEEGRLVMQLVPGLLYYLSMARSIATDALLSNPDYEPVPPFLISVYHQEVLLISRRLKLSQTNPDKELTELEERQLRARLAKCRGVLLILRSAGEKHFYRALSLQLHDNQPETAAAIIDDLSALASPELNTYPDPPVLLKPVQPVVVDVGPVLEARRPGAAAEAPKEVAEKLGAAAVGPRPVGIAPGTLFGERFEAEAERVKAAAQEPPTLKEAPPAERETLNYLIATARRRLMRRKAEEAAEEAEKREEQLGRRAAGEANPLFRALESSDKGVRYGAAAALARINPRHDFAAAKAVVEILGQAITEEGVFTVLVVSADDQSANLLREIIRSAGHMAYAAGSTKTALSAARVLPPKDLIIVHNTMPEAFEAMQKDPVAAAVPVMVFTTAESTAAAENAYKGKVASVISLKDERENIEAEILDVMVGRRALSERANLAAQYARTGAIALDAIPGTGSPFSRFLVEINASLVAALDSDDSRVRVSAITALGKAKVRALIPRLIDICLDKGRSVAERSACMGAIGNIITPSEEPPPEVVDLVKKIHQSGDRNLRRLAAEQLAGASVPPAELEKLINWQESAGTEVPPP